MCHHFYKKNTHTYQTHNYIFFTFEMTLLEIQYQTHFLHYLFYNLRGFTCLDSLFFQFKNVSTLLYLSRNKTKRQFDKNTTLTPTKTLSKKQNHSTINFEVFLFTNKLDFQNKNYIYKIKTKFCFFFLKKKNPHHMRETRVMRLVSTLNTYFHNIFKTIIFISF